MTIALKGVDFDATHVTPIAHAMDAACSNQPDPHSSDGRRNYSLRFDSALDLSR